MSYVKNGVSITEAEFYKERFATNHKSQKFKSDGPLCDFHKSGDLDLELYPISKKIANRQANRQTDRGDQYTLRKSEISQSNKETDRQRDRGDQYTLRKE